MSSIIAALLAPNASQKSSTTPTSGEILKDCILNMALLAGEFRSCQPCMLGSALGFPAHCRDRGRSGHPTLLAPCASHHIAPEQLCRGCTGSADLVRTDRAIKCLILPHIMRGLLKPTICKLPLWCQAASVMTNMPINGIDGSAYPQFCIEDFPLRIVHMELAVVNLYQQPGAKPALRCASCRLKRQRRPSSSGLLVTKHLHQPHVRLLHILLIAGRKTL